MMLSDTEYSVAVSNRALSSVAVLDRMSIIAPAVLPLVRVVGRWLWVEFDEKPGPDTLRAVKILGFRWSRRRSAWQHPCGDTSRKKPARNYDPRDKYGCIPVGAGRDDETGGM